MLVGPPKVLTAEAVATLGRADNAKLRAMLDNVLDKVDTSQPLWGAVAYDFALAGPYAFFVRASLDPRGSGSGSGTLVFFHEDEAAEVAEGFGRDRSPTLGLISAQRDGATVTMRIKSDGPFIPLAIDAAFKGRRMARETVSSSNLRQLSMAIVVYESENDGKMPPDLKALATHVDEMDMGNVLKSPLSKGKLPAGESDYVYIPLGRLTEIHKPSETIMLYERPENHDGKGTIVAFIDGHVERVDMKKFKKLLKAAQALAKE